MIPIIKMTSRASFKKSVLLAALPILLSACATQAVGAQDGATAPTVDVTPRADISFQPLNPARGDASPKAGVLWGDISKNVPSGALLEFADGFSSPPHIHNITYRAVVISGAVHNDDPGAENMWMGPGSFWTQPAGENHITAAKNGGKATAFLEILEGPYLVQPSDKAFENGEQPINLVNSNIMWLGQDDLTWVKSSNAENTAKIAFLWGDVGAGQLSGSLVKLPKGYEGALSYNGEDLRGVVIEGLIKHKVKNIEAETALEAGSYFASTGNARHQISCSVEEDCTIYIRTDAKFELKAD